LYCQGRFTRSSWTSDTNQYFIFCHKNLKVPL
jgi:hypothetical protein